MSTAPSCDFLKSFFSFVPQDVCTTSRQVPKADMVVVGVVGTSAPAALREGRFRVSGIREEHEFHNCVLMSPIWNLSTAAT